MFICQLHLFGISEKITPLREVEMELRDGADMRDIVSGLRKKIPALEGPVIRPGEDRLQVFYKFNINGRFYFDGTDFELHKGDQIALLAIPIGG